MATKATIPRSCMGEGADASSALDTDAVLAAKFDSHVENRNVKLLVAKSEGARGGAGGEGGGGGEGDGGGGEGGGGDGGGGGGRGSRGCGESYNVGIILKAASTSTAPMMDPQTAVTSVAHKGGGRIIPSSSSPPINEGLACRSRLVGCSGLAGGRSGLLWTMVLLSPVGVT